LPATKAILIVIDGLTPAMFERAVERGSAPALSLLVERGDYRRAATVFPSLTPVCISSLVTGEYPDRHGIPHLVWYHRGEGRLVEYGSSFAALRRAGIRQGTLDAVFRMNEQHLSREVETVFESAERNGLVTAGVNIICYRGETRHAPRLPGLQRPAFGPKRFYYFSLYASDLTGAPFRVGARHLGANDAYAAAVGRWLVTRDGFDLLVHYLPDYDFASHATGPDAAHEALKRSDAAVQALIDAAGGIDALLERYAVVLCSDHGQTRVEHPVSLHDRYAAVDDVLVTASNRAGMVYDLRGGRARELALRLDGDPSADVVLFLEDGAVVARRAGAESADVLDAYPDGAARAEAALRNPNAGDVLVSAAPGYEFTDLAGRHHAGGGSHGSLTAGDSEVPMLAVGLGPAPASVTGVAPLLLAHVGARSVTHAA
jgi:predicted AlkP superfamily pyrophosphatase or phosphodiesterase